MRVNGVFLAIIGVFFGIIGIIYWFLSYDDGGGALLAGAPPPRPPPRPAPPRPPLNTTTAVPRGVRLPTRRSRASFRLRVPCGAANSQDEQRTRTCQG